MSKLNFVLFLIVLSGCNALPIEDEDVAIEVANGIEDGIEDNDVGGDGTIDLSHLGPEAYGVPTSESGDALSQWNESSPMNPEEMGEYAEGDILIPQMGRNGMRDETTRWPGGIIPYVIEGRYNQDQRDTIMKAIADYHRLTCLRFVPYNGQKDYITIQSGNTGCWSSVGRIGGRQEVNLQNPGCVSKKGTVLHELLHAVGFMHEQSRPERDEYVDVRYQNIKSGSENNFKKSDAKHTNDFGVSYDYNSVMHYSEYAFSRNGMKTIEPKESFFKLPPPVLLRAGRSTDVRNMSDNSWQFYVGGVTLGQREGLSRGDVRKVNAMYNCKKEEPQGGWMGAVWQGLFG